MNRRPTCKGMDAGGVLHHTQVGFEAGDEKKYENVIQELPECACARRQNRKFARLDADECDAELAKAGSLVAAVRTQ